MRPDRFTWANIFCGPGWVFVNLGDPTRSCVRHWCQRCSHAILEMQLTNPSRGLRFRFETNTSGMNGCSLPGGTTNASCVCRNAHSF